MTLRGLLLGSKLKVALAAVVLITASVGGAWALGAVGAPGVAAVENRFGAVNQETTVVQTDLVVHNPNPIGVQLGGTNVSYEVAMNNVSIANGSKSGLSVGPGNTTLNFSTRMYNEKIPDWWVTHVRNDERTEVSIDARARTSLLGGRVFPFEETQTVETDIIGQFDSNETRPVNAETLPPTTSNPVLYVNRTSAEWGTVTDNRTPINMQFVVYNPKVQPYTITEIGGNVTMNGVHVGSVSTDRTYVIPGGATRTLKVGATIRNQQLDDWWVTHLRNNQVTDLKIDFYARVELPTGNEVRVPLDRLTYEKRIETDIFGNKNESDVGAAAGTTPTPAPTPTAEAAGTTATATPTASPTDAETDTPTRTPTSTDDGVLGVAGVDPRE